MKSRRRLVLVIAAIVVSLLLLLQLHSSHASAQTSSASPDDSETLRRGLELARQGQLDQAVAQLRLHVQSWPDDAKGHYYLGRLLAQIAQTQGGSYREALAELETALQLDPSQAIVQMQLADVYGVRRPGVFHPDKTIQLYEQLRKDNPDRFDVRMRYAKWIFDGEVRLGRSGDPKRVWQDSAWAMDVARFHLEKVIDQAPARSPMALQARTFLGEV